MDAKKNMRLIGKADGKKKTPVKKHNNPTYKLFKGCIFSIKNLIIYSQ